MSSARVRASLGSVFDPSARRYSPEGRRRLGYGFPFAATVFFLLEAAAAFGLDCDKYQRTQTPLGHLEYLQCRSYRGLDLPNEFLNDLAPAEASDPLTKLLERVALEHSPSCQDGEEIYEILRNGGSLNRPTRFETGDAHVLIVERYRAIKEALVQSGSTLTPEPIVGTLPLGLPNAATIPAYGGVIITFDTSLMDWEWYLSKIVAWALSGRVRKSGLHYDDQTTVRARLVLKPEIVDDFGVLVLDYLMSHRPGQSFRPFGCKDLPRSEYIFARGVSLSAGLFVLGHEVSHIANGHLGRASKERLALQGGAKAERAVYGHDREFEADRHGLLLTRAALKSEGQGLQFLLAGPTAYFTGESMVCNGLAILSEGRGGKYPPGLSHPPPLKRLEALRKMVSESDDPMAEEALAVSYAIQKTLELLWEDVSDVLIRLHEQCERPSPDKQCARASPVWSVLAQLCTEAVDEIAVEEEHVIRLNIQSPKGAPLSGVEVGTARNSGSAVSGPGGRTRLHLPRTIPNGEVKLELLGSRDGEELRFLTPYKGRLMLRDFTNASTIVVVEKPDRQLLESDHVIRMLISNILEETGGKTTTPQHSTSTNEHDAVAAVAREYDLVTEELLGAIRSWGERAPDPYDQALVVLAAGQPFLASQLSRRSLEARLDKEKREPKDALEATEEVIEAAMLNGDALFREGKYAESAEAYRLAVLRRAEDPDLLNAFGRSLALAGQYEEAEQSFGRALAISEDSREAFATSLNYLAMLYRRLGRYEESELLYQRSLAIREEIFGPDDSSVAEVLSNLAELRRVQRRYEEAEPLYLRALSIYDQAEVANELSRAATLSNFGGFYEEQGRLEEARGLYARALGIYETELGPDNTSVATVLHNLAGLNGRQGRYDQAEALYQRALAISESALGPDHPEVGITLTGLAVLYEVQERFVDAQALLERALAIFQSKLGPDHDYTVGARQALIRLQRRQ